MTISGMRMEVEITVHDLMTSRTISLASKILRAKRASFRRMPTVQSKAPKDIQPCMHPSSNKARTPEGPSPGFDGVVLRPQFGPRRCSKVNTIQVREKR